VTAYVPTRIAIVAALSGFSVLWCGCVHSTDAGDQAKDAGASGAADASSDGAIDSGVEQVDAATSCSDLFTIARQQLGEASACDTSSTAAQCSGVVSPTCGCPAAVDSQSSTATQSYLNTLAVIQAKKCGGTCPPEFCEPTTIGACVTQVGGSGGVCVRR
jgi:hypothetical protein